ncbi:uncharacterized protein LOC110810080 [Carica papaya]|uniref:uncharacterized protein LOC110810080 n=1 Tax=Carica papaya TaxID=3649 RepID=UPI000B8D142B|nr:uncharacterized protein LOC110810080 [Carica papaya]
MFILTCTPIYMHTYTPNLCKQDPQYQPTYQTMANRQPPKEQNPHQKGNGRIQRQPNSASRQREIENTIMNLDLLAAFVELKLKMLQKHMRNHYEKTKDEYNGKDKDNGDGKPDQGPPTVV